MTSASKQIQQFGLLLSVLVLAALLCWEVGLRVFWHNPYVSEAPDHILKMPIHHPNSDHVIDRSATYPDSPTSRLRTDARSYILPSFQYEDPDATVVFMGGSTTAALSVSEDLRFPALVSKHFAADGLRVNALNIARGSGTAHDSLNLILNHVVLDEPDVIVIMNSSTDQALLTGAGDYRSRMGGIVGLTDMGRWGLQMLSSDVYVAGLLRRNLSRGSGRARRGFAMVSKDDSEIPIERFEARMRAFVGITRAFRIVPVMVTEPLVRYDVNHKRFNEMIRTIGREMDAKVVDLANHIENETPGWDTPMKVFYDGVHVTEEGSAMYADYLYQDLLPLVREVARKRDEAER